MMFMYLKSCFRMLLRLKTLVLVGIIINVLTFLYLNQLRGPTNNVNKTAERRGLTNENNVVTVALKHDTKTETRVSEFDYNSADYDSKGKHDLNTEAQVKEDDYYSLDDDIENNDISDDSTFVEPLRSTPNSISADQEEKHEVKIESNAEERDYTSSEYDNEEKDLTNTIVEHTGIEQAAKHAEAMENDVTNSSGEEHRVEQAAKHADAMEKDITNSSGVDHGVEQATKHAEAMDKIAKYKHLVPYVQRLFRIIDKFANRKKYDNVMAMFDQLILDLWDAYSDTPTVRQGRWIEDSESQHSMNCTNLKELVIHEELGAGYIKAVHRGTFHGTEVAVKVKNMNAPILNVCGYSDFPCAVYRDVRMLGEALLIETLQHPLIIGMIGYCVHSGVSGSPVLEKPGVVGVYPLGNVIRNTALMQLPWREKIFQSVQLSSLMVYVEQSPFGRLTLYDFERHQFVWIDGHMYLSDMDVTMNNADKKCSDVSEVPEHTLDTTEDNVTNCHFKWPYQLGYEINVQCVNGLCLNTAQKHNMVRFYFAFFLSLFTRVGTFFPKPLQAEINAIMLEIRDCTISADNLRERLKVLHDRASAWQE